MGSRRWIALGFLATLLVFPVAAQPVAPNPPANPQNGDELPTPIANVLRRLTRALAEQDDTAAQDIFSMDMPQYLRLVGQFQSLIAREMTNSTIEVVRQEGDDEHRTAQLDWLMQAGTNPPKRAIVTVNFAKVNGEWRIVGFDPIDWFGVDTQ